MDCLIKTVSEYEKQKEIIVLKINTLKEVISFMKDEAKEETYKRFKAARIRLATHGKESISSIWRAYRYWSVDIKRHLSISQLTIELEKDFGKQEHYPLVVFNTDEDVEEYDTTCSG
jgi:hypothetical protein